MLDLTPHVFNIAQQRAVREGYESVNEFVTDLILGDDILVPSAALNAAIQEGLDDMAAGRVMSYQTVMQNVQADLHSHANA